jgi:hypothetical protein
MFVVFIRQLDKSSGLSKRQMVMAMWSASDRKWFGGRSSRSMSACLLACVLACHHQNLRFRLPLASVKALSLHWKLDSSTMRSSLSEQW